MQYDNHGYVLLHHIFNVLSPGKPLIEHITQHITLPLGMRDTFFDHVKAGETGHRGEGFFRDKQDLERGAKEWESAKNPPDGCLGEMRCLGWSRKKRDRALDQAAWAGLVSSPNDIVRFPPCSYLCPLNPVPTSSYSPSLSS
jgi:CubicO group peptidase (beta-lactamase class C family)